MAILPDLRTQSQESFDAHLGDRASSLTDAEADGLSRLRRKPAPAYDPHDYDPDPDVWTVERRTTPLPSVSLSAATPTRSIAKPRSSGRKPDARDPVMIRGAPGWRWRSLDRRDR